MHTHPSALDEPYLRAPHGRAGPPRAQSGLGFTTPAEVRVRRGQTLVVAGFVVTVLGIVAYCSACFTGGISQDFGEVLSDNAVPFAGVSMAVVGVGTAMWLVGSFMHLSGLMDLDPPAGATDDEATS